MTPRDRRALRIGVLVVVGGALLLRGVPALWSGWMERREALRARRELLSRAEEALARIDSMEAQGVEVRAKLVALAPRLVSGRTDAEAQADLNGRLALIANRERTRLVRAAPLPDSTREAQLHRVRLRVEVESDWSGLVGFLRGVVADPAVLRVTSVALRGSEIPVAGGGPEVLTGELEVTGWFLSGRASEGEGAR